MFILTDHEEDFITKYLKNGKEKIKKIKETKRFRGFVIRYRFGISLWRKWYG